MGLSAYVYTFFAIEAPRSTFFVPTGETRLACSRTDDHHIGHGSKFCPDCGAKVVPQPLELPTEIFQAFCDHRCTTPAEAFEELKEYEGWEWTNDTTGDKHTIGWYKVQAVDHCEINIQTEATMALGLKLATVLEGHAPNHPLAYSASDLAKLAPAIQELADIFNLTGEPKLYVQLYLSF